ncbi:MAG: hypothetical protein ACI35O_01155 [Bacillaceae bacterium]
MVVIHYYSKKTELVNLLCQQTPLVGDNVVIKGRKAKILDIKEMREGHLLVEVELEAIKKVKINSLDNKKKRRH